MRICIISREYPPDTGFGGIATFSRHLAYGLTDLGHEVEVVCLAGDKAKVVKQDGITIHRVDLSEFPGELGQMSKCMPYSRYVLRANTALWEKFLALHKERPFDAVDSPELLAEGLFPAVTAVAPLVTRLYTPHSKFIAERLHNVKPSFDHQLVAALERMAMLSADVLTSPSDDLAEFVAGDLNYPQELIKIVRNPIDAAQFSVEGEHALDPVDGPTVLFVGRLEERKGIHYLFRALPEITRVITNLRLVVIGDDTNNGSGQKSVLAELKQILKDSNCEKFVHFIPRVPLQDLPKYYRSADVCVVPSVYDNSPYTCLEAMSCGKAVIGTSGGGTKEYVVDGKSGLIVPPRDPSALAKAIVRLLTNDAERRSMAEKARERVLSHFDRKEIARQMVELYTLAGQRHAKRQATKLYLKSPDSVLVDAEDFLVSLDSMLRDFLYVYSYRYRIHHWKEIALKRPRLFAAKLLASLSTLGLKLMGRKPDAHPQFLQALRQEIAQKEEVVSKRACRAETVTNASK